VENFEVCDGDLSSQLLARYLQAEAVAIDTETMGLNPLRDRLCLIQVSDANGYVSAIRIGRGQTSAPNLKQLLERETITKIFHFARFDLATLQHHLSIVARPVFCTKIASKIARTYTQSHGLKALVQELEGIELDKTQQSSDWGNVGALSDQQLSYAANDVRYLHALREKLTVMLKREDRWTLTQQCLTCLPTFVALDLQQYSSVFEH
jgi:ribonuclease D